MALSEHAASGLEALALATNLLQRARLADPLGGLWEAADLQWWWRTPRRSDAIDQAFWLDDEGPVAAAMLTEWRDSWGCDLLIADRSTVPLPTLVERALDGIAAHALGDVEMLIRDDDHELREAATAAGFAAAEDQSGITWMDAADRPLLAPLPDGFRLTDRTDASRPHPMRQRNGERVDERLRQCSLYDPSLDLSIEAADGEVAGYALFWADPVTSVGLLEPMRVEEAFQRRGLARALLTAGLDRLAGRGAQRFKVGFSTDAARALYVGAGFKVTATATNYRRIGSSRRWRSGGPT